MIYPQVVSLKFAIIGGSRSEGPDQKGAAHFLSTTAFAGAGDTSGLRLVRYLERLGASFSASADKEKVMIISDIVCYSISTLIYDMLQ